MSWPETEQERLTRIADEWMEECTDWCFEGNRQDLETENAALWAFVKAQDVVDERVKSWHGGDGSEPYEDWPGPLEERDFAREMLRQYEATT